MGDVTFTLPREFAAGRRDPAPVVRIRDSGPGATADGVYTPFDSNNAANTDRIEINEVAYDATNEAHQDALRYLHYVLINPPPTPFSLEIFNRSIANKNLERMSNVFANFERVRLAFAARHCEEGTRLYNDNNTYIATGNVAGFVQPSYFLSLQEFVCSGLTGPCESALANIEYCTDPNPWAHAPRVASSRRSSPSVATPAPALIATVTAASPSRAVATPPSPIHRQPSHGIPRWRAVTTPFGNLTPSDGGGFGGYGAGTLPVYGRGRRRMPVRPPSLIRLTAPRPGRY